MNFDFKYVEILYIKLDSKTITELNILIPHWYSLLNSCFDLFYCYIIFKNKRKFSSKTMWREEKHYLSQLILLYLNGFKKNIQVVATQH